MKANIDGRPANLPDFLIVGAARSGTTSLYNYLRQHPHIFMSDVKEPQFFSFSGKRPSYKYPKELEAIWKFDEYLSLFRDAEEGQTIGEASTQYLYFFDESIRNIKKFLPEWENLKIIIILRNPIERAYSQYSMLKMNDIETLGFKEALSVIRERIKNNWRPGFDYVSYGLYYNQVKAFLDNFHYVKVYLYDDLRADTVGVVDDIFKFIGVERRKGERRGDDTGGIREDRRRSERRNNSFMREIHHRSIFTISNFFNRLLKKPNLGSSFFPPIKLIPLGKRVYLTRKLQSLNIRKQKQVMKKETRQVLNDLFYEDILALQELIGRDLSAWLN